MIPSYKEEPGVYHLVAGAIVAVLARYCPGIRLDDTQVLELLIAVAPVLTLLTRRRTVAVHPSSGLTVKPALDGQPAQVAPPKKP